MTAIEQHFANIRRTAFWSDGPHDIGQVFRSELGGGRELLHISVNFNDALLALDASLAAGFRHQGRTAEADASGSATVVVVDRLHGACDDGHAIDWHHADVDRSGRRPRGIRSLGRLRHQNPAGKKE